MSSLRAPVRRLPAISVAQTLSGEPGIVDLWYCFYEDIDPDLLPSYDELLTPDERERLAKFHFERDRVMFLVTRALVRVVLSGYAPVEPGDWRFVADEHGKPRILSPEVTPMLHFNLANTLGLVVCAVSVAHESLGVDAERTDREVDHIGLADRYFSPSEAGSMRALPAGGQSPLFFAYWTLKESYIKARGLGLSLPLDQFSFVIGDDAIGAAFDTRLGDDAGRWSFALLDAPPSHTIAVSVETAGAAISLRASAIAPLSRSPYA